MSGLPARPAAVAFSTRCEVAGLVHGHAFGESLSDVIPQFFRIETFSIVSASLGGVLVVSLDGE